MITESLVKPLPPFDILFLNSAAFLLLLCIVGEPGTCNMVLLAFRRFVNTSAGRQQ
jgi:hypothetical protein